MRAFAGLCSLVFSTLLIAGCSGGSGGSDNNNGPSGKPVPSSRVDWSSIPSEYNPSIEDVTFRTQDFNKIDVDIFGFNKDVEVLYSNELAAGEGFIRLFRVWKDQASFGSVQTESNGSQLKIRSYGQYACSIRITNKKITSLEGGCYVRQQVFLPVGSEIEVTNVGGLISKRFIPISNHELISQVKNATWAEEKFSVIENYLASYKNLKKAPSLTTNELGQVLGEFSKSEDKFQALRRLHKAVSDRENLGKMIDDKFSYFDREEARAIVGL